MAPLWGHFVFSPSVVEDSRILFDSSSGVAAIEDAKRPSHPAPKAQVIPTQQRSRRVTKRASVLDARSAPRRGEDRPTAIRINPTQPRSGK
jgi:hypothetical protein